MVCEKNICGSCTFDGKHHKCCREPNCATCTRRKREEKEEKAAIAAAKAAVTAAVAAAAESKERFARAHLKRSQKS
jgi:hypothetical protein